MRIALLDPCAGVAGDMLAGALVDAGADLAAIQRALARLRGVEISVSLEPTVRCGVSAAKFRVVAPEGHVHRGLADVLNLLEGGDLPPRALERAARAFRLLAAAEAKIHATSVDKIHFHEVGAADAIADIAGAALALDLLGVERLYCRPLPLSTGTVCAAHGTLPLPAPATLELLKGWPVRESGLAGELVTPTGAACVAAWCERGSPPVFTPERIGYGAGDRDPSEYPNVCRVLVGEGEDFRAAGGLCELVCDVDDATPQILGHLLERLLQAGALDATLQPVGMKKGRPGTRIGVLAREETVTALEELLFTEGTTLGVRRRAVERTELPREIATVKTPYGEVRVKVGYLHGRAVHVAPEYEDCRARAEAAGVPVREVLRAALDAHSEQRVS